MMVTDKWSTDLFLQILRSLFLLLPFSFNGVKQRRAAYRSKPLVDGDTLTFPAQLATVLGTNEALILQKFHEWIEYNQWSQKQDHYIDGRWWTYNSYEKWQEKHFSWLSVSSVKRICKKLEASGVLVTGRYAKSASDQTKWYSIDYQKLSAILSDGVSKRVSSTDQKSPVTRSKESNDSNKESSKNSQNPQTAKHQHHQTARVKAATTVDGDDAFVHDSGEDIIVQKMHEAPQSLRENVKHEADAAPNALSPSSAAPLPYRVGQLVLENNLNPAVALRWIESASIEECERAAEAAIKARWANDPAALWCSFMQKRDYQHVPPVQKPADDYSTNYSPVDDTPDVDEYETEVDPAPYIDPERVRQWQAAFIQLKIQLDQLGFTWLRDSQLIRFESDAFVIGVRSDAARQMLTYRLNKKIDRVLEDVVGAPVTIRYEVYEPRKRHEENNAAVSIGQS